MKARLSYIQRIFKGGNMEIVEKIMKDTLRCGLDTRSVDSRKEMETNDINEHQLEIIMGKEEMARKKCNLNKWKEEMIERSDLGICNQWKNETGQVDFLYDNRPPSVTLFQVTTNSLPLQERMKFQEYTRCPVQSEETENVERFSLYCDGCNEERKALKTENCSNL